jgi:hypothetical protein
MALIVRPSVLFEAIQGTLSIFVAEEAGELVQQCVGLHGQLSPAMLPLGK